MGATLSVTEQLVLLVTVPTSIQEATDSYLGAGTDCSDRFFVGIPEFLLANASVPGLPLNPLSLPFTSFQVHYALSYNHSTLYSLTALLSNSILSHFNTRLSPNVPAGLVLNKIGIVRIT